MWETPFHHFISFTAINIWPDTSITCLTRVASVVFLAVAFKTNQRYKCLFPWLPPELVSSKKSQASAMFINKENGGVHNHSGKTYHYLCMNKLHMVLTWQVIVTTINVLSMYNNVPIDVQIAAFGVTLWKYLLFTFFLSPISSHSRLFKFLPATYTAFETIWKKILAHKCKLWQ